MNKTNGKRLFCATKIYLRLLPNGKKLSANNHRSSPQDFLFLLITVLAILVGAEFHMRPITLKNKLLSINGRG